jgi:hypothetical protein
MQPRAQLANRAEWGDACRGECLRVARSRAATGDDRGARRQGRAQIAQRASNRRIVGRVHQAQRNRGRTRMVRRNGDLTGGQVRAQIDDAPAVTGSRSVEIPMTVYRLPASLQDNRSSEAASLRHGLHQLAQTLMTNGRPR